MRFLPAAVAALLLASGCGAGSDAVPTDGGAVDATASTDALPDAPTDTTALDAPPDALPDASTDTTALDAPPDALPDAPTDTAALDALPDAPTDTADRDDYLDVWAHGFCDDYGPCCAAVGKSEDIAGCMANMKSLVAGPLDKALAKGSVVDRTKFDGCRDTLRATAALCGDASFEGVRSLWSIELACIDAVQGSAPPGGACESAFDCQQVPGSHTTCDFYTGPSGSAVFCQREIPVGLGEACDDGSTGVVALKHVCDPTKDLHCELASKTCVVAPAAGSDCLTTVSPSCDAAARCDASHHCVPRVVVGGTCTGSDCVPGAFCDSTTTKCAPQVRLGEPCADSTQCISGRCTARSCGLALGVIAPSESSACK